MKPEYTISGEALNRIYNTLVYYANTTIYDGERTGGVLAGCPRSAPPTADQIVGPAKLALHDLEEALGREPEQWLRDAQAIAGDFTALLDKALHHARCAHALRDRIDCENTRPDYEKAAAARQDVLDFFATRAADMTRHPS